MMTTTLQAAQSVSVHPAFALSESAPSPTGAGTVEIYRHTRLGFPVVVHRCEDPNKVFCAGFLTPHRSDDGLPHVLEHLVLAGSREFPISDPFFTALKGSFSTFQNAMTATEITLYPCATINSQEFLNLSRIYLDAIFHPLLTESGFRREGWRLEKEGDAPVFNGTVYNEMKGVYSRPSSALYYYVRAAILGDVQSGRNSGGDPRAIPDLSYEALKEFHELHYHPSRAVIVIHGDHSPSELTKVFALIDEKVEGFEPSQWKPEIHQHAAASTTRVMVHDQPVAPGSALGLPRAAVAWAIGPVTSLEEQIVWGIVDAVLIESETSPLKRFIVENKLAANTTLEGTTIGLADAFFCVGGEDIPNGVLDQFESAVVGEIERLVQEGFPKAEVDAALNQFEFQLRKGSASQPLGLAFARRIISPTLLEQRTLHYVDPLSALAQIRDRLTMNPRLLEGLVADRILANPDRVFVKMVPSHQAYTRAVEAEAARVVAYCETIGPEGVARELEGTAAMVQQMGVGDDPSEVARIPALRPKDLPSSIDDFTTVERIERQIDGVRVAIQGTHTSGIVYVRVAFDISRLPARLIGYAPLVSHLMGQVDTTKHDFIGYDRAVRAKTGGISTSLLLRPSGYGTRQEAHLVVSGAALQNQADDLVELMREQVFESRFADRDRVTEVLSQMVVAVDQALSSAGHSYAINHALASVAPHYRLSSMLQGFDQRTFLKDLQARMKQDWEGVARDLQLFSSVFSRSGAIVGVCGETDQSTRMNHLAEELVAGLESRTPVRGDLYAPREWGARVGLGGNMQVAFVATAASISPEVRNALGHMEVLERIVRYDYLLPEIRQKNGAYGAGILINALAGVVGTYTYRSRQQSIEADIATSLRCGEYLLGASFEDDAIQRAAVGAAAEYVPYEHPAAASYSDFSRFVIGLTPELRRQAYRQIISCSPDDIRRSAEYLAGYQHAAIVRAVSTPEALTAAGMQTILM
jgi:Zn-dependent M16 (insulinase) family peptidase